MNLDLPSSTGNAFRYPAYLKIILFSIVMCFTSRLLQPSGGTTKTFFSFVMNRSCNHQVAGLVTELYYMSCVIPFFVLCFIMQLRKGRLHILHLRSTSVSQDVCDRAINPEESMLKTFCVQGLL